MDRDDGIISLDGLIAAAEVAADHAGAVIRRHFRSNVAADIKDDASPVTIADQAAEQAMRAVLAERTPNHAVLGEEGGWTAGSSAGNGRFRWVLDPIDGTRAFITGRPVFATLVALLDGDTPVLGVIDQPITGERWVGAVGRPTRFRGPFGAAGCRPCATLDQAELSCTSPAILNEALTPRWRRLASGVRRVSWGGDAYAYGLLALGQIDVIAEAALKLWDWAALVPVIEGAGGCVTDWQGRRLRPDDNAADAGQVLALGDPALLPAAIAALAAE